ncbi:MAG: translation initiation factor IF-2 subunit alpha, partial [Thermoprotei archaeon]
MVKKRKQLPDVNELVIGTVRRIYDHGAFVTLDEYNDLEAYIPLNEVSHTWFRNIR